MKHLAKNRRRRNDAGLRERSLRRPEPGRPTNRSAPSGHGFPAWYQDLNGTVLDLCIPTATAAQDPEGLQETACLLAAPPALPYIFPTNFPDEVFFHRGVSAGLPPTRRPPPPGRRAVLVLALEAAFASGAPQPPASRWSSPASA